MVNLGGTQKVDFLGTCFGSAGLGLDSWAMISLMGTRVQHYGVHVTSDGKPGRYPRSRLLKKQRQSSIVEPTFAVWPARGPRR